jgi:hypothetical protein
MTPLADGTRFLHTFSHYIDRLEEIMEFRLTYEGEIVSGADCTHSIRKCFHKQLVRLWNVNPNLKGWRHPATAPPDRIKHETSATGFIYQARPESRLEWLANQYRFNGYRFAPIIHLQGHSVASLDVLFLRGGDPARPARLADLDGRLKILGDALRMPKPAQELGQFKEPEAHEDPFFVVMEDDSLIGNISITCDTLLEPTPGKTVHDKHDCRVVISVSIANTVSSAFGAVWQ